MQQHTRFDVSRIRSEMDGRGWHPIDLARRASVSASTISRFLSGERQTARVAKKIADAFGYSVRRYQSRVGAER